MVKRLLLSENLILLLCAALFLGLAPFTPGLATRDNVLNLLGNLLPLLLVATGQTVVLIAGGIDLSVSSTIALTSVLGASVMNHENGWLAGSPLAAPAAVVAMLFTGAAVGLMNGFVIATLRLPPFIMTLTSMMFVSGFAVWWTRSKTIYNLPSSFTGLGGHLGVALAVTAALCLLIHVLLTRSVFGRWLFAVGQNARTALVSGVPVSGVVIGAYAMSGLLAASASLLYTARLETGSPVMGQRILLDVIGAAVIGGTSLFGGKGKVQWTLGGVLFLTLLDNALNLRGLSHFTIMMVKGGVILLAAGMDVARHRTRTP